MTMPQILVVLLIALAIGVSAKDQGKTRTVSLPGALLAAAIWLGLLFWGGFFHG